VRGYSEGGVLNISANIDDFERSLSDVARKQLPFAVALALNDTAADVRDDIQVQMKRVFDRPTRWTLNAFMIRRASKRKLSVRIERKSPVAGKHYLEVEQAGGVRPQTAVEKLVSSRLKYGGVVRTITPAKGARLNSYGNWSPGQRNQVLSAVQSQRDATANTTAASRKRAKGRAGYFVPRDGSKLSPGIYQRMARNRVKKVVHISDKPARYRAVFKFETATMASGRRNFPKHFAKRFKHAMATAK